MAKVIELKDAKGENRIKVTSKGRITYLSTEGYHNKQDMVDAAIHHSKAILKKYAPELLK
jgi:hypothetical protein